MYTAYIHYGIIPQFGKLKALLSLAALYFLVKSFRDS